VVKVDCKPWYVRAAVWNAKNPREFASPRNCDGTRRRGLLQYSPVMAMGSSEFLVANGVPRARSRFQQWKAEGCRARQLCRSGPDFRPAGSQQVRTAGAYISTSSNHPSQSADVKFHCWAYGGRKLRMGKKKLPESGPPLALWKMGAPVVPLKPMSAVPPDQSKVEMRNLARCSGTDLPASRRISAR